ncbi:MULTISPECIES: hypothetical protein [unclassified Streptomyces]|uniref:hypothetical protein n=1 Tax=unclassified Streptomyces TaxID=2593676 RepID=UPI0033AA2FD1
MRGREAHAALLVGGGAGDEHEAKSVTISLRSRTPGGGASRPVDVPPPVPTLYADDGRLVTYRTTAPGLAPDFVVSK